MGTCTDAQAQCGQWQAFLVKNGFGGLISRFVGISSSIWRVLAWPLWFKILVQQPPEKFCHACTPQYNFVFQPKCVYSKCAEMYKEPKYSENRLKKEHLLGLAL